jgi:hypothetical protein
MSAPRADALPGFGRPPVYIGVLMSVGRLSVSKASEIPARRRRRARRFAAAGCRLVLDEQRLFVMEDIPLTTGGNLDGP